MLNETIVYKVTQRLNKIASMDYDNIEKWQIVEAFNKAQVDWCRRQIHGMNQFKEGDEQSTRRIDDLQVILKDTRMKSSDRKLYSITQPLPEDFFEFKRVTCSGKDKCCPNKHDMQVYLAEEGNVNILLRDELKKPSYDWGETFCTLKDNRIRIYTNGDFSVSDVELTYYRQPRRIQIRGSVDPYTNQTSSYDVLCEFKDDIVEVLIDETVKILSGDIESINRQQISSGSVEMNN